MEVEFAHSIKHVKNNHLKDAFISHFSKNMFLIITPEGSDTTLFYKKLQEIRILSSELTLKNRSSDTTLELFTKISKYKIDTQKELNQIEVNLINAFDMM